MSDCPSHHQAINTAISAMAQYLHDRHNLDVQIIATHYSQAAKATSIHSFGFGNHFARKAACRDWLLVEDTETNFNMENRLADDDDNTATP
jgi:hypothetical protein